MNESRSAEHVRAALAGAVSLRDLERLAERVVDDPAWQYLMGGSDDEITLGENRRAFERLRFRPRVLRDVSTIDTKTVVLGQELAMPVLVAPMAYHRLYHPEGEPAVARATARAGGLFVASTMASTPLEEVPSQCPRWFQVYVYRDREITRDLVLRAKAAGFSALVLTVDAPRLGKREREARIGFGLPAGIRAANFAVDQSDLRLKEAGTSSIAHHASKAFDATLGWESVAWLAELSQLPVIVKGILTEEDARLAVDAGAKGIIVSNHGGRQLDGSPATIDCVEEVAKAASGRVEVLMDGGVRRGSDIVKALALGARAVLVGRPFLHGLAVGGDEGVLRVFDLLKDELETTMALLGRTTLAEIDGSVLKC